MAAKYHYKFNSEKLTYVKVDNSFRRKFKKITPLFIIAAVVGILFYLVTAAFYETPFERKLRTENSKLALQYRSIKKQLSYFNTELNRLEINDDSLYRSLLGLPPLPVTIRQAGTGGRITSSNFGPFEEIVKTSAIQMQSIQSRIKVQQKSYADLWKQAEQNKEKLKHIPAIMPISHDELSGIGSGFGLRMHPILNIIRPHEGIDFNAQTGTPVHATADGRVIEAAYSTTFGNVIKIDHGYGMITLYAHLNGFNTHQGKLVKRGEIIGFVGNTGLSTGSHVHYEVHINGKAVDPVHYFFNDVSPEQYELIVDQASQPRKSMD